MRHERSKWLRPPIAASALPSPATRETRCGASRRCPVRPRARPPRTRWNVPARARGRARRAGPRDPTAAPRHPARAALATGRTSASGSDGRPARAARTSPYRRLSRAESNAMSARLRADCVIVGGGPAGSTTALLLARAGFDVVVLEHREFPRAKPCGDCVSPRANLLLDELGLLPAVRAEAPAQLAGWRIHGPEHGVFSARFSDYSPDPRVHHGIAISRERLDAVLLAAARSAGARVLTGSRAEQLLN